MEQHQEILSKYIQNLQLSGKLSRLIYQKGKQLYELGHCHLLASSADEHEYLVKDNYQDFQTKVIFGGKKVDIECSCKSSTICSHAYASVNQTLQDLSRSIHLNKEGAMKYSREGMMKRVLEEREKRAKEEKYELDFSDNIYGEHQLLNEHGKEYKISFYDFEKKLGYCSCPDYQTNKLETCKHLMFAFQEFEKKHQGNSLPNQSYPFLEIFRHPLFDYQISWFYPHEAKPEIQEILDEYFDKNQLYKANKQKDLHLFFEKLQQYKSVNIRPEVKLYIEEYYEGLSLNEQFANKTFKPNILLKNIYPFQQKGIEFISPKQGCILADEIGTGKSVQALGAALYKIEVLGFQRIKILAPLHLKKHWKDEIQKWIPPLFTSSFIIESFEEINTNKPVDFLIIDEAQKITDYDSYLLQKLHRINYKHILLITDSKLENSLIKFYAMAGLINQYLLTPLWELSYKHCLFDPNNPKEIVGYYNLDKLPNKLQDVYLRREKLEISEQLPEAKQIIIPVALDDAIKKEQSQLSSKLLNILEKKKTTSYDLMQFKTVFKQCYSLGLYTNQLNSTDKNNPKLLEFKHFISHKLNLNSGEKVVIFIDHEKVQQQVKLLLQNERKAVQIIDKKAGDINEDIQFFITSENLQDKLPIAQHFIYYHIPKLPNYIAERQRISKESGSGIQQNNFYLLLASQSLEDVFYQWIEKKPYFLNQVLDYLSNGSSSSPLSLRLQEEIGHELKSFIQLSSSDDNLDEVQMDLFGQPISGKNKKAKKIEERSTQEASTFIHQMLETFSVFEKLNPEQKQLLMNGNVKISDAKDELIIHISKKVN